MNDKTRISTLGGIFRQLCPRCRLGRIYRSSMYLGFPKMHERCPVCGLKFEREAGYFLGAMYISYGFALAAILLLASLLWIVGRWSMQHAVIGGMLLFLPLAPALTFLSRVAWIYLDQAIDPEEF